MESKSLKVSWIILLVPHAAIVINGLIWALFPNVYLSSWFESFMGQSWADFVSTNAQLHIPVKVASDSGPKLPLTLSFKSLR